MFEAGLFYTLLGIAFILIVIKVPYKFAFYFLSSVIFLALGFVIWTGNDVAFYSVINDGTNIINQTSYVVGDNITEYNENGNILALMLVILGMIFAAIGIAVTVKKDEPQK